MTTQQIQEKLKKDLKRYRTLQQISKNEEYKLAHSMIADYIEETLEEIKRWRRNKRYANVYK